MKCTCSSTNQYFSVNQSDYILLTMNFSPSFDRICDQIAYAQDYTLHWVVILEKYSTCMVLENLILHPSERKVEYSPAVSSCFIPWKLEIGSKLMATQTQT